MRLGLFTRAYQELDLEEAFSKIDNFGIRDLEIVSNRGSLHLDLDRALNPDYYNKYVHLLEKFDFRVCSMTLHRDSQLVLGPYGEATSHFFPGSKEEQMNYGIERTKLAAKVAKEYQIPLVVGYLGCEDFSQRFPWPSKDGWSKQLKAAYERWMPILEYYELMGVKFAHEVGPQQIAYDLETALVTCETLNIDSLGICFDPSNLIFVGVDPALFIDKLGKKILHVHGKDAELTHYQNLSGWLPYGDLNRTDRGIRFRIPGWGDINWKKVLTALKLNNYNGVISIEYEDPTMTVDEGIEKAIEHLQPLLFNN